MKFRIPAALILSLCGFTFTASAQVSINGSLRGRVTDAGGAAVAGATVTLAAVGTNTRFTAATDSGGEYSFPRLAPGDYTLAVERDGFRRLTRTGLSVSVNEAAAADVTLQVGGLNDAVTVEADAQIVQSQATNVSQIITERRLADLPLNSKDFQKLTFLAPGVGGQRGNNASTNYSVSGARDAANNYVIDGASANDERQTAGLAPGNAGLIVPNVISTEALREFRVITSNADATFGRGSGGQINVITKSGTNDFHGSAYEYLRNDALDARDFFNNRGPFFTRDGRSKVPPFKQHLFGATLGGPLTPPRFGAGGPALATFRDRHFFFASYEGFRQKLEQTSAAVLPNADLVRLIPGDLGRLSRAFYFDLNIIPATGNRAGAFSPLPVADRTAAVNAGFNRALFDGDPANGEAGTVLVSGASTRNFDQDAFLVRTDHNLTNKLTAAFRYAFADNLLTSNATGLPTTVSALPTEFHSAVAQFIYTINPAQVLEVRAGALRGEFFSGRTAEIPPALAALGVSDEAGIGVSVTGTTSFATPSLTAGLGFRDNQTVPQLAALHTWTRGRAVFRSGLDVRRININFQNGTFATPSYSFIGLVGRTGLLGASPAQTDSVAASVNATLFGRDAQGNVTGRGPTTPQRGYRSTQQEYFVQSDWRVRPTVTLNAGVRYSYFGPYAEVNGGFSNLYAVDSAGRAVADVSPFTFGRTANNVFPVTDDLPLYQPDRNNFQPRVGLAWDIAGKGRTVVRAAYGVYHDRLLQLSFSNLTNNVPFAISGSLTASAPDADRVFRLGSQVRISPRANPVIFAVDPTIRNPYSQRFNAAVEQQLDANTSLNVAYVGLRGRKLIRTTDPNFAGAFPQDRRPDPRFADQRILINGSRSEYDALQIYGQRRLSTGVSFTVSYTLGRLRDDTSTDTVFSTVPTNTNLGATSAPGFQVGAIGDRPIRADFGYSEIDIRHNFVVSHLIQLPFGRGRRFMSNAHGLVDALLGGFDLAGIAAVRSGARYNVTTGTDFNDDGAFNDRPALLTGRLNDLIARGGERTQVLLPAPEARTRLGTPANVTDAFAQIGRNAFRAPLVRFYDASLIKRFQLAEAVRLSFEANVFNVFNQANFRAPVSDLSSALFGRTTGSAATTNPRQIQLGLKLTF
jgi:hypothetical protein